MLNLFQHMVVKWYRPWNEFRVTQMKTVSSRHFFHAFVVRLSALGQSRL